MKALTIVGLVLLVGCGVKGPPERPSGASATATQKRVVIGGTASTEAPGAPLAAAKRERRFVLDGLL